MRKHAIAATLAMALMASPAWAIMDSKTDLVASARIPMEEAIRSALMAVPGKAVEAQIEKESGKVVYSVDILDQQSKTVTVFIDAQTGKPVKIDR
jgi:uncharacterized membrane protein YkoI